MRPFFLTIVLLLAFQPAASAQARTDRKRVDDSVDQALKFLQGMQEKDGSWTMGTQSHPAITSLAILAYLSAGHVPGEGPYKETVEKGIDWVLKIQNPDGLFSKEFYADMYNHGICTLMLSEVCGMTDEETSKRLRPALVKAVRVLLKAQRLESFLHKGGWRYSVMGDDADLSVTGWQLMALRAARNLGCDVPAERIDLAVDYVLRCREPSTGAFCYQPGGRATLACTGTALLALELTGKVRHKSPEALKAGSYVLKNLPRWDSEHFLYAMYYCSQGMFQLGQNYWEAFRPHMVSTLLERQQGNGSWLGSEGSFSPVYSTSMAVLALTVENRYLPIYQRHEEPEVKGKSGK